MILITGATGNLGKSVVNQFKKAGLTSEIVVSSSNEAGVKSLQEDGLNARLANFNDVQSLEKAFAGIKKILLISTMEQNRFEGHKNVVDAATKAGVEHIVYTGLGIVDISSSAVKDLMISHFQTENYIKEGGLKYTFVRNTMYADALQQILGEQAGKQSIQLPGGDGKVPYALRREMGEAIANLLVQDEHANKVYNLIGSQFYSYAEIAAGLSILTGNYIDYIDVDAQQFREGLANIGFPDFLIYLHAGTIEDIKNHQYEVEQNNVMEKLLGRKTADLNSILKELFQL